MNLRSIDEPRERPAPAELTGIDASGHTVSVPLSGRHLIVAVKPDCDGCRSMLDATSDDVAGLPMVFLAAQHSDEWRDREVLVSPGALEELGITWPPFYVVVDSGRIVGEGVVFGPRQVAEEIRRVI